MISSPGAVAKDAVQLDTAKALKTGARSTPHTAPQPLPAVDLVAEAAKLREAWLEGPRRPSKPERRRMEAASARVVLRRPLRLMPSRGPAGAVQMAPPG